MTEARFPNLLNNQIMLISASALRQANDNYNREFNRMVAEATRNAEVDLAQFMCQNMAGGDHGPSDRGFDTPLAPPFSISYDVGMGLTQAMLTSGGQGVALDRAGSRSGGRLYGRNSVASSRGGVTIERTAVFNRQARNCRVCTIVMREVCKQSGSSSWFHNSRRETCNTVNDEPVCEDIEM